MLDLPRQKFFEVSLFEHDNLLHSLNINAWLGKSDDRAF